MYICTVFFYIIHECKLCLVVEPKAAVKSAVAEEFVIAASS